MHCPTSHRVDDSLSSKVISSHSINQDGRSLSSDVCLPDSPDLADCARALSTSWRRTRQGSRCAFTSFGAYTLTYYFSTSTNIVIILGMIQVAKKVPFEDPNVLNAVRALYAISNLIILGVYYYIKLQIDRKKGEHTMSLDSQIGAVVEAHILTASPLQT